MREILFRGKRVDNGEWVYGNFCMDAREQFDNVCCCDGFIRLYDKNKGKMQTHEVERATVGQYTGMNDKNGQRIFEGDIVRITWYAFERKPVHGIYDVVYVTCGFYVKQNDRLRGLLISYATAKTQNCGIEVEVIGNIHDNPKLVEREKL